MSHVVLLVAAILITFSLTCLLVPVRLRLILDDRRRSVVFNWLVIGVGTNLREKTVEVDLLNRTIVRKEFGKVKEGETERRKRRRLRRKEEPQRGKGRSRFTLADLWRDRDLFLRVTGIGLRFFWDILKAIRWDGLLLNLNVSTPDPAVTGILYGELCAVKYSTEYCFPEARVQLQPDFVSHYPKGSTESAFSIRPLNLAVSFSKMFLALPKIRLVKTLIRLKRR
jgi:hypothetical protein